MHENRRSGEDCFEGVEDLLSLGGSCKCEVLAGELCEVVGDERESLNKPAVEVGKTKEGLFILVTSWSIAFLYSLDLG